MAEGEPTGNDRLDSWKAIATFLDRDVSTVRRWEKAEGMPVHRHQHAARGSAYAYKSELSQWFAGRRMQLEPTAAPEDVRRLFGRRAVAGVALIGATIGVVAWAALRRTAPSAAAFQARDWVLVGAIDNRTSNPHLDGALEYALERELAESRYVNVVPQERVADTLQLMTRPRDTRLDRATGIEVCLRDGGIRALLTVRVEKVGDSYNISALVLDPRHDGQTLGAASVRTAGEAHILDATHQLSDRIRQVLGERGPDLAAAEPRLERVTTGSLRALQLYSHGMQFVNAHQWAPASALLQQAVDEDPDFASARIYLAHSLRNLRRPAADWLAQARKALDLARRTTDRERYFIIGSAADMSGDNEKAITAYQSLVSLYPDDYWGVNNLALADDRLGRVADGRSMWIQLAALRPNDSFVLFRALAAAKDGGGSRGDIDALANRARLLPQRPDTAAFLDFLPLFYQWTENDAAGVVNSIDPLRYRSPFHTGLAGDFQMAVGQLAAAAESFATTPHEGDRHTYLALIALHRGDTQGLVDHAVKAVRFRSEQGPLVEWLLLKGGRMDELQAFHSGKPHSAWTPHASIIDAVMKLATRYDDAAVTTLVDRFDASVKGGEILRAVEVASDALVRHSDLARAAALLHQASDARIKTNLSPSTFTGIFWLRLRARLAAVDRQLGRTAEADQIDAEIAKLLALADPDFRLVP